MNKQSTAIKEYEQVKCCKCKKRLMDMKSGEVIIKCGKCGTLNVVKCEQNKVVINSINGMDAVA